MNEIANHRFVFVCGLHRSGTSPLFKLLREHPDISGFRDTSAPEDEGQHLQTVFPPAKNYGGPGRFGFAPEAHLTEDSALVTPQNRTRLFAEWSKHWDLSKLTLLEKSPPNLIRTRFLQAMFPDSYFIVLLRHPVAVSLATSKWSRGSVETLIDHWLHCHRLFGSDRSHLRRALVLRYEELIRETGAVLDRVYKFVGLPPRSSTPLDPAGNDRYFRTWRNMSADPKSEALVREVVAKHEGNVLAYGYTLRPGGAGRTPGM